MIQKVQKLKHLEKRWNFLNELRKRGVEVGKQPGRYAWDIVLIKIEIEGERKQLDREWKLLELLGE